MTHTLSKLCNGLTARVRTLRMMLRGAHLRGQTDRNIWNLYLEVFWAGLFSAAASFNATFAVRLGASNTMIGWLSSIPSLIAVLILVPSARFLERRANRTPWIWGSLFVGRLGYGLIAALPWLLSGHQAESLIGLLIALSLPNTFFGAGFGPLMADVVPERDRARVMANRSIIVGITVAVTTFLAGKWLEASVNLRWGAFPANYQIVYIIGFLASMMSMVFLLRIKVPESKVIPRAPRVKLTLAQVKSLLGQNRDFVRLTVNTLAFSFGEWLISPLYIIFFIRHLEATDGWIGLNSTLANIGAIIGYTLWQRWINKLGYMRALLITIPFSACYSLLVGLFPNLTTILVWGVLINVINPGLSLSHYNILLKLSPPERRASYIAIYSSIMNVGAFIGPMIGVALSKTIDIRLLLIIGGSIRLAGALLFYIFRIRVPESERVSESIITNHPTTTSP
jgi:MFS family permease